jgi:rhamnosyltransferase
VLLDGITLPAAEGVARSVDFHDSLLYVIGRASGWSWLIDSVSSVEYRQHESNVMGANVGVRSAIARLRLIRGGWFRGHAVALARVAMQVAPASMRPELAGMLSLFEQRGFGARLRLARRVGLLRRRVRDQGIIAVLILIGIW